jgi:membrane fusion protein
MNPPTTLFRKEVFQAKHETWLGRVQIVQPLPIRIVALVSAVLIAACIMYLTFGTYTRRVHAQGVLIPEKGMIVLASPSAGVISGALASEGEKVRKGQLLYIINLDATSSSGPTQQQIISRLQQQRTLLQQQASTRRSMAGIEKQSIADKLKNLKQQYEETKSQVELQRRTVAFLKDKVDQLKAGLLKKIVRDADFQSQNALYIQSIAQQAQYEQLALQLESQITEAKASLELFDNKLNRELAEVDRGILQVDQMIAETEGRRSIEIRAPTDGLLTAVRGLPGQQVGTGTSLVTLLPSEGKLTAHLYVDSSAIAFIGRGKPVLLRYAAFPFQRFGLYRGVVKEVTRAPIASVSVSGASTRGGSVDGSQDGGDDALFRIVVEPDEPYVVVRGVQQPIEAGMRVAADVALEKRPLYRWLLDPVYQARYSLDIVSGTDLK